MADKKLIYAGFKPAATRHIQNEISQNIIQYRINLKLVRARLTQFKIVLDLKL